MTTPLEQIRKAELEAARRVDDETLAADRRLREAHEEARSEVERAARDGDLEADRRFEESVTRARAEARRIEETVAQQARVLQEMVEPSIDRLAVAMLDLVLAPPEERGV